MLIREIIVQLKICSNGDAVCLGLNYLYLCLYILGTGIFIQTIFDLYYKRNIFQKKVYSNNFKSDIDYKIAFEPRKTIQSEEHLWEDDEVWLEIVGDLETEKYSAILKKLVFRENGVLRNVLSEITNSFAPRLRITNERIYVAETNQLNIFVALSEYKSNPLPKSDRFYIEIELRKNGSLVSTFKGHLITGNCSKLEIRDFDSNI